jgi:ATP-dependent DNA ligase
MAFDLLQLDGEDDRKKFTIERKAAWISFLAIRPQGHSIQPSRRRGGQAFYEAADKM